VALGGPDGSIVLFTSLARDLIPGQVSPAPPFQTRQAFLFRFPGGPMEMASHSVSSPVTSSNAALFQARLSGDGRTVVTQSNASDLTTDIDANGAIDLFGYDSSTGLVSLVSGIGRASRSAVLASAPAAMSPDGRYVVFTSLARNVVAGQTGQGNNLFWVDRFTGQVRLVSHAMDDPLRGTDARPEMARISSDGRHVIYVAGAFLAPGAGSTNCYAWDRATGLNAVLANPCNAPSSSPDGRFMAYTSPFGQVYFLDRTAGTATLVSRRFGTTATPADANSSEAMISADGRWVAFSSTATDLIATPTTRGQVFLFDVTTGAVTMVSHRAGASAQEGDAQASQPVLTPDGSHVAFVSTSTDLVAGQVDQPGTPDMFLHDRVTGVTRLLSYAAASRTTAAGGVAYALPALSHGAASVAYLSSAGDLVAGQVEPGIGVTEDVFLYDLASDRNVLVSRSVDAPTTTVGASAVAGLSADGSKLLFASNGRSLVPGQVTARNGNVFLYERETAAVTLVSRAHGSVVRTGNGVSVATSLSTTGAVALLGSEAPDLVPADYNDLSDVFVYSATVPPPAEAQSLYVVTPCRLADTRLAQGDWGGPSMGAGFDRAFVVAGRCGIPTTATAVSLNVTVTGPTAPGNLRIFGGGAAPFASVLNYAPGQTRANSAVTFLGPSGEVTIRCDQSAGAVDVILDVNGYFE
jgi:Tol biopolymer transport system component